MPVITRNDDIGAYGANVGWRKVLQHCSRLTREGMAMGVSKRIAQIPNDLIVGETWVLLAHPKAIPLFNRDTAGAKTNTGFAPGIFQAFKPSHIEYIVTGNETEEELNRMEKRGITLIDVTRDVDMQTEML